MSSCRCFERPFFRWPSHPPPRHGHTRTPVTIAFGRPCRLCCSDFISSHAIRASDAPFMYVPSSLYLALLICLSLFLSHFLSLCLIVCLSFFPSVCVCVSLCSLSLMSLSTLLCIFLLPFPRAHRVIDLGGGSTQEIVNAATGFAHAS